MQDQSEANLANVYVCGPHFAVTNLKVTQHKNIERFGEVSK